ITLTFAGPTPGIVTYAVPSAQTATDIVSALASLIINDATLNGAFHADTSAGIALAITGTGAVTANVVPGAPFLTGAATPSVTAIALTTYNVDVVRTAISGGQQYTITFQNALGDADKDQITIDGTNLKHSTNQSSIQTVTVLNADGGTFTLSFGDKTTGDLAFNADATGVGSVQEALNNLDSIKNVGGSVAVTRNAVPHGFEYVITF